MTKDCLAQIKALNPSLKAVVEENRDALRDADAAAQKEGPLAGIPFTVKDTLNVKGFKTTLADKAARFEKALPRHVRNDTGLVGDLHLNAFGAVSSANFSAPEDNSAKRRRRKKRRRRRELR